MSPEHSLPGREPPIFVFGAARSGTTLTYSLLLASGCFPIYEAESRILECASRYGSLRSERNREAFLGDFLSSRQFTRSGLTRERVSELAHSRSTSYVDFLDGFMGEIARVQGKTRWVEKSPNNAYFIDDIASHYDDALFLNVVRDGRSVTASQRKLGWGSKYSRNPRRQLLWIGNVWDLQVAAGMRAARFGPRRFLQIRYEDLIRDIPKTLQRISAFAGIHLDESMVDLSHVGALGGSNTAFTAQRSGIFDGALDRWRTTLAPDEVALLDWQLGDRLRQLGYPVDRDHASPTVGDRFTSAASRLALDGKRMLNLNTPVGRFASKPLELGVAYV